MEMRKRINVGRELEGWEAKRKEFFETRGWEMKYIERKWEKGLMRGDKMVSLERRRQERERWNRVLESRSNKDYKFFKKQGIPGYLCRGWSEDRWKKVAKFRLGDGLKGGWYWENRKNRRCEICGCEEESWEHVWEGCTGFGVERGWQEMREEVLGDDGQGKGWLVEIEKLREGKGQS
ncbi:GSCOCG00012087001-RA-CDS [Cotesia congregata]|nr:GSCOCG00012087001-RA-CDS [Cotesia congregata]